MLPCGVELTWLVDGEVIDGPYGYNEAADIPDFYHTFETEGKHTVTLRVEGCCGTCEYTETICVGPKVSTERVSCLFFRLHDNHVYPEGLSLEINVFNTKQEKLETIRVDNYRGEQSFDIKYPFDGIYIVEYAVFNTANPTTIIERKRFVHYDFCSILVCYKKLLFDINCATCNPCGEEKTKRESLDQLNMFVANLFAFVQMVTIHYGMENNHFYFKEEYLSFLDGTQDIIDNLLRICGKCGFIEPYKSIPKGCVKITSCGCGKV